LTSGLVILGKTSSVAQSYSKSIMNRSCRKIYLARVAGKFPLKYQNYKKLTLEQVSKSGKPSNGEWREEACTVTQKDQSASTSAEKSTSDIVHLLRKKHALACWIEDERGKPIFEREKESHANILEEVFQCRHSVEDWLKSIDEPIVGKGERVRKLWFHLACPTRIAKHKDGVCEASSFDSLDDELYKKTVKPAHSSFGVVSYDRRTDSTLLICRPYTGRTHQLRLHLQHLEHPIANDPNYGGDIWYGNPLGKESCKIAQDRLTIINEGGNLSSSTEINTSDHEKVENTDPTSRTSAIDVPATESEVQYGICAAVQQKEESIHSFIERTCVWCARCRSVPSEDRAILEFVIRSPGIWLHALQYSFPVHAALNSCNDGDEKELVKSFRTILPDWHEF